MAFTNSIPAAHFVAEHKVTTQDEQKLKLEKRGEWLERMIQSCEHDLDARLSFESDLAALRNIQAHLVPDAVIIQRCSRLADIRQKFNIRIKDKRAAYRRRNAAAVANEVAKLCGGAA